METKKRNLVLWTAGAVLIVLVIAFGFASTASSRTSFLLLAAPTKTPPAPGDKIPLKSIDGLKSINAEVQIDVNGKIDGERTQGGLTAAVATNDQGDSKITVTGDLLGDITAKVGGSLVGLFTPSSVDIYKVPQGKYIVLNSLVPICVKPKASDATDVLDDMSSQGMMAMLTNSDVARGRLVGEEKVNGAAVKHYVINGDAFLDAAKKSTDKKLSAFGKALWSAEDADLYLDAKGSYPVALSSSYGGSFEPLGFEGDFDVQYELTGVNKKNTIKLPSACNKPITP